MGELVDHFGDQGLGGLGHLGVGVVDGAGSGERNAGN
jgi:hypothetical protein